jgi:pectate lyase
MQSRSLRQWTGAAILLALTAMATAAEIPRFEDSPVGWASVNASGQNGVTGGEGGTVVTVDNQTDLRRYCDEDGPYVIQVQGSIVMTNQIPVLSDKTVIGLGDDAEVVGRAFLIEGDSNIIIRNLTIRNSTGDGLTLEDGAHHVWIDHCTLIDTADGAIDIGKGSDYVTISWCKFLYTADSGHNFVNLIGSSDGDAGSDAGKLRVTFHHNWWSTLCVERMPRVRFGKIHCFNNYVYAPGNNYCIRAGRDSEILSECNYFKDADEPFEYFVTIGIPGKIHDNGSILDNCTNVHPAVDDVFTPPYDYACDSAANVPAIVTAGAGAGNLDAMPNNAVSTDHWHNY